MRKSEKTLEGRRNFLKISAAGAAGLAVASSVDKILAAPAAELATGPGNRWPGRVVIDFNTGAVDSSGNPVQAVITKMVDDSVLNLTGATTVGAAWKAVFPASLTASSKIAIKIPCGWNGGLGTTNCYVVKGIVAGLQQMTFGGTNFPAGNIYVYDGNGTNNFSAIGITAALLPGVNIVFGVGGSGYTDGANNLQYAKTLHDCDYLINVPSIRGHWAEMGQVTIGFKNHYGTYSPVHGTPAPAYLRDINCTGPVYNKTVLTVVSAIYGQNLGDGPGGAPEDFSTYAKAIDPAIKITSTITNPTTVIMSTDPVSAEMQAIKIMRLNEGQAYSTASMPAYLLISGGINSSYSGTSLTALNIGTISEASMDIRRIINGSTVSVLSQVSESGRESARITVSQIKGGRSSFIEFTVPDRLVGATVSVEIYDARGTFVRGLSHKVLGTMNHLSWDETDVQGNAVAKGMYVAHLVSGVARVSSPFAIVR